MLAFLEVGGNISFYAVVFMVDFAEPYLSELSELSDATVGLSDIVGLCRTVGCRTCRSTVGLSEPSYWGTTIPHCRTLSDCPRTVGLSDCRTVGLSGYCRTTVGLLRTFHTPSMVCQPLSMLNDYCVGWGYSLHHICPHFTTLHHTCPMSHHIMTSRPHGCVK